MSNDNTMLKRLLEQQAALNEKIKQARKQEEKRKAQLRANKAKIIGLAILAEIETNQVFNQSLQPIINRHIKNSKDRKMLGLTPLETPTATAPVNDNRSEGQDNPVAYNPEINQNPEEHKQAAETKTLWKM